MRRIHKTLLTIASAVFLVGSIGHAAESGGNAGADDKRCLSLTRLDQTEVVDDRNLLFHMKNGEIYRNELSHKCPGLKFEDAFLYETSINQLCSLDSIHVLMSMGHGFQRGAACGLGKFTKIDEEQAEAMMGDD